MPSSSYKHCQAKDQPSENIRPLEELKPRSRQIKTLVLKHSWENKDNIQEELKDKCQLSCDWSAYRQNRGTVTGWWCKKARISVQKTEATGDRRQKLKIKKSDEDKKV